MAKSRGATHCLNGNAVSDMDAEIRKIVGAKGPDKVIETTGAKSVIELAYNLTHADGTCVLVGVPSEKVSIYTLPIHFNKVLTGSHGGDAVPHVDIPRLIRLIEAGRLSFEGLITHEFPLDDINAALDVVRSGTAGRVLLRIGGAWAGPRVLRSGALTRRLGCSPNTLCTRSTASPKHPRLPH